MVYGWPVRLLRVLWIAALIVSGIQSKEYFIFFSLIDLFLSTAFYFIVWIIATLIPLQYILLNSINPTVLIEDFVK